MKTLGTEKSTWFGMALLAVALLLGAAGCGATTSGAVSPRLAVQQEKAVVLVEGQGEVEGGTIACGPAQTGTCEGEFADLWATHLLAKPAPGWKFSGWTRNESPALAPSFAGNETVTYTARFERDAAAVATAR